MDFMDSSMVICTNSLFINTYDLEKNTTTNRFKTKDFVNNFEIIDNKHLIATVQDTTDVELFDYRQSYHQNSVKLVGHTRNNFAITRMGENYLATGGEDSSVRIWDLRNPMISVQTFTSEDYFIRALIYHEEKKILFGVPQSNFINVWKWSENGWQSKPIELIGCVKGIQFSPNKKSIFFAISNECNTGGIAKFQIL